VPTSLEPNMTSTPIDEFVPSARPALEPTSLQTYQPSVAPIDDGCDDIWTNCADATELCDHSEFASQLCCATCTSLLSDSMDSNSTTGQTLALTSVRFDADFESAIGDTRGDFLIHCSAALAETGVVCFDVYAGSVVVSLVGQENDLGCAVQQLESDGFLAVADYPSLPFLGMTPVLAQSEWMARTIYSPIIVPNELNCSATAHTPTASPISLSPPPSLPISLAENIPTSTPVTENLLLRSSNKDDDSTSVGSAWWFWIIIICIICICCYPIIVALYEAYQKHYRIPDEPVIDRLIVYDDEEISEMSDLSIPNSSDEFEIKDREGSITITEDSFAESNIHYPYYLAKPSPSPYLEKPSPSPNPRFPSRSPPRNFYLAKSSYSSPSPPKTRLDWITHSQTPSRRKRTESSSRRRLGTKTPEPPEEPPPRPSVDAHTPQQDSRRTKPPPKKITNPPLFYFISKHDTNERESWI